MRLNKLNKRLELLEKECLLKPGKTSRGSNLVTWREFQFISAVADAYKRLDGTAAEALCRAMDLLTKPPRGYKQTETVWYPSHR